MKVKSVVVLLLFVVLFVSCGKRIPDTFTAEMIDGVKNVHNLSPQWGDEKRITLEHVRTIGGLENADENFQFNKVKDIALDKTGNIYILDAGNHRIQKYDKDWNYLSTIGRMGQGPGEFTYPGSIEVDKDGNIYVGNGSIEGIKVFDSNGKEIRRIELEKFTGFIRLAESGEIVSSRLNYHSSVGYLVDPRLLPLVHIYENDGTFINEFCQPKDYDLPGLANAEGNEMIHAVDEDENVYVAFAGQNRIEKFTLTGDKLFQSDRTLAYEAGTEIIPGLNALVTTPVSYDADVDEKNRLWILSNAKQPVQEGKTKEYFLEFEVLDSDGILLAKIPFPDVGFTEKFRIYKNMLYLIQRYQVYEYCIVEK
ncbi:NHL repeat-containing protein [candidate division KSB1 bacterium]